jgi:hypothetical protein
VDDRDLETLGIDAQRSEDATDGRFALHLTAREHIACASKRIEHVLPGHHYRLSFDYKTVTRKRSARVRITFDPDVALPQEEMLPRRKEWTTHDVEIIIPPGATSMDVIFMTEGDGMTSQGNLFDHVQLQKTSYLQDENLFVVAALNDKITGNVPSLEVERRHPWQYRVDVSGAREPFLLVLEEFYHEGWRAKIQHKGTIPSQQHVIANLTQNGWYIDQPGDYRVILEYAPQGVLNILMIISLVTGAAVVSFWLIDRFRSAKESLTK